VAPLAAGSFKTFGIDAAWRLRYESRVSRRRWQRRGGRGDERRDRCPARLRLPYAVRDDAFYVPRLLLERWADSGPIEGYRGWFPERAGPSNLEDAEVTGT
jgi:hypothetical protein